MPVCIQEIYIQFFCSCLVYKAAKDYYLRDLVTWILELLQSEDDQNIKW